MDNFDLKKFLYNNTLLNEDEKEDIKKSYGKDVESFRSDLSKYIAVPKVKAVLDSGLADGDPNDDKLPFTPTKIAVKNLTPTQKEIGFDQSVKGNLDDEYGSLDGILKGNVNVGGPIVTYAGKYIIDGHHRWSTVFAANPKASMDTLDIAPKAGFKPLDILKAVHSAIAVNLNKVPSANPKGVNILTGINYPGVLGKVEKYLTPEAEDVWASNGIKGKKAIAKHLYDNLDKIVKNGYVAGAPGRKDMPQTDANKTKSIDKLKSLSKGEVNITEPFEENKKSLIKNIIKEEVSRLQKTTILEAVEIPTWLKSKLEDVHTKPGQGSIFSKSIDSVLKLAQDALDKEKNIDKIANSTGTLTVKSPGIGYNLVLPIDQAKKLPGAKEGKVEKTEGPNKVKVPSITTTAPLTQFKSDELTFIVRPKKDESGKVISNEYIVLSAFPGDPLIPRASEWNGKYAVIIPNGKKEVTEMNKSDLKQLIKEEIQKVLDEERDLSDKEIMSDLKNEKEGVYVLKGGLERGGGWNKDSLQKGKPLYYTTDTLDPKLKLYKEDEMVWITIENGEMEVENY